jgi:hypothetical protein
VVRLIGAEREWRGRSAQVTRRRDEGYVHVSWLAKLMAGEMQCEWSAWFKTHFTDFERAPSDFQRAQWLAEHSQAVSALARERLELGERVYREAQNDFRVEMAPRVKLAGRADLVCVDTAGQVTVYEVKTGKPQDSHLIQTMLYMLCSPYDVAQCRGRRLAGCVVYKTGSRLPIPADSISSGFRRNARYFLDLLASMRTPPRVPSPQDCRFCDIGPADCPERIEWDPAYDLREAPVGYVAGL